jgi:hypothetical protein
MTVLKTVAIFLPNMAPHPGRTERGIDLPLACLVAEGVRGWKPELDHFLNQHGAEFCLLSETFLKLGQAFRLPIMPAPHRMFYRGSVKPSWSAVG